MTVPNVAKGSGKLPIEWGEELSARLDGLWLIKGILPQQGVALIYGHSGSGKSFLALDLAMHLVEGRPWLGRRTTRGVVVYVAAEGASGMRNRVTAYKAQWGIQATRFGLVPTAIDLFDPSADKLHLIEAIKRAHERYKDRPVLVVVDTLSQTLGAGKENTDDMAAYARHCQEISSAFACCVLIVHHRPKDAESSEPRGHGSLKAAVDTLLLVENGNPRQLKLVKQKDGEEGPLCCFELKQVALGRDGEGEVVTSCVVCHTPAARGVVRDRLSSDEALLFEVIRSLVAEKGQILPAELQGSSEEDAPLGVQMKLVKENGLSAFWTKPDQVKESVRRQVDRRLKRLQNKGLLSSERGYCWLNIVKSD